MIASDDKSSRCKKDYKIKIGILLTLSSVAIFIALFYESTQLEDMKLGILLSDEDSLTLLRGIQDELTQANINYDPFIKFHQDSYTLLKNFKKYMEMGIDHFIISSMRNELYSLCEYINITSISPTLWSYQSPPSNCHGKVRVLDAQIEAHLMVLANRLLQARIRKVIIVSGERNTSQKQFLLNIFHKYNIEVLFSASITPSEFWRKKQILEYLAKYPHIPLLLTSVEHLFAIISILQDTTSLKNRMILSYIDPRDAIQITRSYAKRSIAEKLMLYTTAYRNKQKVDEFVVPYKDDVLKFEEYAISRKAISFFKNNFDCVNPPKDANNQQKLVIELSRFVPDQLRSYIMQDHLFFLEQVVHLNFSTEKNIWTIQDVEHSTIKILTKFDLYEISKNENCEPVQINITATENYRLKQINASYNMSTIPPVLLVPNSNPDGFIIKIQCGSPEENEVLEIGCFGTSNVSKPVQCLAAKSTNHRRRIIRSYTSNHIIPVNRQENVDKSHTMMSMIKVNRLSGIVPQIAGCVGASGGCSICFAFLQFIVPDGNPGVCYGACAVGIGGACTSFIATGLQRSQDFTVICSELFYQGHIDLISYMADAKFGSILTRKNPLALKGYQIAATPLVYLMRKSPKISSAIYYFASPWIHHMEYEVKLRETDNTIGHILTTFGIPIFSFLGFCFLNITILLTLLVTYIIIIKTNWFRYS